MRTAPSPDRSGGWLAVVALAWLAVGLWLRFAQFGGQIVIEDEWHALHRIVETGARGIVTSFGSNDYSIPLTLYDRWLMLHGALTEWTLKAPMAICGAALLVVAPWLFADRADRATRVLFGALLAVSPLLVYFTNTARPYAITVLAATVAVAGFRRWWRGDGRGWAVAYAGATWVGGWLHPITLGFTLLPFAWFGAGALRAALAGDRRLLWRLLRLGTLVLALLVPVLGPPLWYDWNALAQKAGQHSVSFDSLYRTALLLAGTASPWVLATMAILTTVGAVAIARRDRSFAFYAAGLGVGFAVLVGASRAIWIGHALVQARYLLPVLPLLLFAAATGAVVVARRLAGGPGVLAALVAVPAVLLLAGPLAEWRRAPNQFLGHMRYQFDYDAGKNLYRTLVPKAPPPAFYAQLAQRPAGSLTLIEMPWSHESQFNPLAQYQELHRQRVRIGLESGACGSRASGEYPDSAAGIRLANFVHLSALLAGDTGGADYLVVRKLLWAIPGAGTRPWPDMEPCLPALATRFGLPVFEDAEIVVFALKK